MIDPVQVADMLASTTAAAVEASQTTPKVPLPTVVKPHIEHVNDSGKIALWVIFVLMLISSAGGTLLSWNVPLKKRAFHTITTSIVIVAAISYYGMATGHAVTYAKDATRSHSHDNDAGLPEHRDVYRQVFWARYVDWAITTPLLLLDLGLLSGMAGGHIVMLISADLIMVLTGLFAALGQEGSQRWGWYAIACIAYLFVIWHLAINARASALKDRTDKARKLYGALAAWTLVLWTIYPVIWAVSEGTGIISVDGEIIAYGVLDLLAKPVFGFWLLFSHDVISDGNMDIEGWWSGTEGRLRLGDDDGA